MASKKIKGITIQYEGDTTKLDAALSSVEKKGRSVRAEMSEVNRALKEAPDSAVLWQQKQELLNKALESSKDKLKLLEDAQEQVTRQFERGEIGEEQYRAFERELERARADTEKLGDQITDTEKHISDLGGEAGKTSGDLDKMGNSAESSSEGFTVLKGAVAQLAADGFEKLMSSAKEAWEEIDEGYDTIIEKTGATGQQLEDMQKTADKVFTAMPVEMSDTGAAVGEINTRFAATGDELESLTEYFLKYSKINNTQVAGSVRNVSGIMKAFQEDTKNTTNVLDVFTDVGQRTGKDLNSLESELLSNSDTFKEMGLDIRQSAELLGQFEANGIDTSKALAGLKKAQQNATAEGKTLTDALGENINKIKSAKTETEALQIASDLFGNKGAAAMTQAIKEERFSIDDLTAGYTDMRNVVNDTFEATQSAPDKAKIAMNNLKLELAKLGEAVLPKIEKFVDKGVQNLPKIKETISDTLPLIKGVGTAYASWKIASTAVKGAEAVKGLATAIKGAEGATSLLNKTMLANPAVAITAGVIGLTVALAAYIKAQEEAYDIEGKVNKQYEDQYTALHNARDEMNKMNDDFNSRAQDIENETARTEALWKELDSLADASGRVKEADKKRAEYILGELNEALGTEYSMTGNQITNYRNLAAEIDTVIAKKKAEALLDEYLAMNSAMIGQNASAQQNYENYRVQHQEAKKAETEAERNFRAVTQNWDITPQEYIDTYRYAGVGTKEGLEAATAYQEAKNNVANIDELMQEEKMRFDSSLDYIHKLDDAERAFAEERFDDVKDILYANKDANKKLLDNTNSSLDERQKAYKDHLDKLYSDIKLYSDKWRQQEANAIMQQMGEAVKAGQLAGLTAGDAFTADMRKTAQKMLDEGFDISELAKWATDSGIDIGDVFVDNYGDIVQKQLDAGFNIFELLRWGLESGQNVGRYFTDEFVKKYQGQLDAGFDITRLLEWAAQKGYEIGDVLGANYEKRLNEYLWSLRIDTTAINSPGDVMMSGAAGSSSLKNTDKWGAYKGYASGGFIPAGGEGIVAEAGPELLEIVNGGVKVTPLSKTVTNTPVGAGDTIINNYYYNSVTASVGSRYDVYKVAEDLETAERRLNQGKGR